MKKFFHLSVVATLICSLSHATIRRVQYWGNPVAGVDYATGNAAVAASAIGDTIMVFQSASSSFTIDKRLVIIGAGYFNWIGLDANFNANLQNIKPASGVYITIDFATGSDGTIVTGCNLRFSTSGSTGINNIKISNCFNQEFWNLGNGTNLTFDNWEFSKCYIRYAVESTGTNTRITNLKMFNCMGAGDFGYTTIALSTALGQTGIIENCSFVNAGGNLKLTDNGFLIQNCIFYNSLPTGSVNTVFNNNVFLNTPSVTGTGNVFNATAADIFTSGTNSADGAFKLKAGSPAMGAGIGGIDCGAYGGVNPYKLSCIPAIPAFYKLTSPGTSASSNPYQITFSVRANN